MKGKHGGPRPNSGRPTKADEVKLVERLSPMDDIAFLKLQQGLNKGDFQFVKLFFEYRYGKPKEKVDITSLGEKLSTINVGYSNKPES